MREGTFVHLRPDLQLLHHVVKTRGIGVIKIGIDRVIRDERDHLWDAHRRMKILHRVAVGLHLSRGHEVVGIGQIRGIGTEMIGEGGECLSSLLGYGLVVNIFSTNYVVYLLVYAHKPV